MVILIITAVSLLIGITGISIAWEVKEIRDEKKSQERSLRDYD